LAVGLDLKFRSVLEASRIQRKRTVKYNRRVRALEFREIKANFEPPKNVFFLAGNAIDPPFISESFDLVSSLNLLDNIKSPAVLLGQLNALLCPGGVLILSSPYNWRLDITELNEWLETEKSDATNTVRGVLEGKVIPEYGFDFTVESEEDVLWPLRNYDRYWSLFHVNLIRARKG
jgi:SAM-dependent methyltransferase